jgi:hypothetical protein
MNGFGLVVTIVVLVGIAVAILLFERRRAEQIDDDLRAGQRQHGRRSGPLIRHLLLGLSQFWASPRPRRATVGGEHEDSPPELVSITAFLGNLRPWQRDRVHARSSQWLGEF